MVKISGAIGSGAAGKYFENEYSNARESYYLTPGGEGEKEQIQGVWYGRLAEEMGLRGEVKEEDFKRLIDGRDPKTDNQLIRHVKSKTYTDRFGNEVKTMGHRAGRDIVFSCPDTFSLCSGPGGDKRIAQWQREATLETLKAIEPYVAGKNGGDGHYTGRMVVAVFQHDCARPDRKTGYAAPNLHDHAFMMNLTKDETGKYRAVEIDTIFDVRDLATKLHWSKLAEKAMRGGYEIETSPRTGAPEITGFSAEYLAENSRRRDEVLRNESRLKAEASERGIEVEGAGLRSKAARMNRRSKKFDREEMKQRHLDLDAQYGYQARNAVGRALARGLVAQKESPQFTRESVNFGIEEAFGSEAVVKWADIQAGALWRGQGKVTYDQINVELGRRIESGELIPIDRGRGPEVTSQKMVDLERSNVRRILDGQGGYRRALHPDFADEAISRAAERNLGFRLNASQHQAVRSVLTSEDQVVGIQGYAGVGKTTALKAMAALLKEKGYEVQGMAPTGRASKLLTEADIDTCTLQKFLLSGPKASSDKPRYYFIDESSLADTQGMHQFLKNLRRVDRVSLIGDTEQHLAIGAGAPFLQLQQEGMQVSVIDQIQRQKDPGLKRVVELFAQGEAKKATKLLIEQGRVREIQDPDERLRTIADDYCSNPIGTLVISPRNSRRESLNQLIHSGLQARGVVKREEYQTEVLVNRSDLSGARRKVAMAYEVGDVIRYTQGSDKYKIKSGEYQEVVAIDQERNLLTVMDRLGNITTYDPKRLSGVAAYRKEERNFAEGDRIQFRAPFKERGVTTGEIGTITEMEGLWVTVRLDDRNREIMFDMGDNRHLDFGYAVTSHSGQGLTCRRTIMEIDTNERRELVNERPGYVGGSRAQEELTIYTNSIERLPSALSRETDKEIALDALKASEERRELVNQQQSPAAEIERTRAKEIEPTQTREIEPDHEHDRGGYGYSR